LDYGVYGGKEMIEKLFTSKNRVKIMHFLFFEKQETYLREISKKLKISPGIVKKELDNLQNILIITKEGNKIKLNKNSNILENLKDIFIKTDAILYPIKEVLEKEKIEYAFIFGSFARRDYKIESDVDLFVIGKIKSIDLYKKIKPIEDKIKREINPSVWTIEKLKEQKDSGFVKEVFANKIRMVIGDENELRELVK